MRKHAYDMHVLGLGDADSAPSESARSNSPASVARPENATRSLFHVFSAALALVMLRVAPTRGWLIAASGLLAALCWSLEIARRVFPKFNPTLMRLFSRIAHPMEAARVNSSTWYLTALVGLAILAPLRAAELGVVVLGLADPAAGFIGRRIGRTKIKSNRSLEGTLGFFAVGTLAALGTLAVFHDLSLPVMLLLASASALTGAITELVSGRLDDNFTIPVTVAAAASFVGVFFP